MKFKEKFPPALQILAFLTALIFLFYKLSDFLVPFLFSFLIAYFLNPLVNFLHERAKFPRILAVLSVMILFIFLIIGLVLLIAPAIYARALQIIEIAPTFLESTYENFYPKIAEYLSKYGLENKADLSKTDNKMAFAKMIFGEAGWLNKINNIFSGFVAHTIESSSTLIRVFSLTLLAPIMIFYLLKDWEAMTAKIQKNLPEKFLKQSKEILKLINQNLAAYARGQIIVCASLAIFYGIGLMICGLESGLAIGLLTGFLAFVPYVGFGIGLVFAFLTALLQWGLSFEHLVAISVVFAIGQLIESNFLSPILIGRRVGLHPLWLIFGLFFFGCLLGIIGVIFSMPLTATFAVLVKYAFASLKKTEI